MRRRSHLTYANVASTLALVLALSGGVAYAANTVFSTDIVDGEVKAVDIGTGAVTNGKLATGAVTNGKLANNSVGSGKVVDNSLTGTDIDESTLSGGNAASLGGIPSAGYLRIGGTTTTTAVDMEDCNPGTDYLIKSINVPQGGAVLVNASFSAAGSVSATYNIAARIERSAPSLAIGTWQESHIHSGRANIAMTQVFAAYPGVNQFVLKVCDTADAGGATAIEGQLTFVYTANNLI